MAANQAGQTQNGASEPYNGLKEAFREILERMATPVKQLSFWLYLIFGVVCFGGLAIWVEIVHYINQPVVDGHENSLEGIKLALATVAPAVFGSSALDLLMTNSKMSRNIGILLLGMFLLLTTYLLAWGRPSDCAGIVLGVVACVGAVCVWWIANGLDELFQDKTDAASPVGGDAARPLPSAPHNVRT